MGVLGKPSGGYVAVFQQARLETDAPNTANHFRKLNLRLQRRLESYRPVDRHKTHVDYVLHTCLRPGNNQFAGDRFRS